MTHQTATFMPQHKRPSSFDYSLSIVYTARQYTLLQESQTSRHHWDATQDSLSLPN